MPTINLPSIGDDPDIYDVVDAFERLRKEMTWLLERNLDTKNAREFAGWQIRPDKMVSVDGDVGMSTTEEGLDPVRFFASPDGGLWLWYVTKSGEMVAQKATIKGHIDAESGTIGGFNITLEKLSGNGIIEGGTVRTKGETEYPRAEMNSVDNLFQALASAAKYIQIVPSDVGGTPGIFLVDGTNFTLISQSGKDFTIGTLGPNGDMSISASRNVNITADNGRVVFDSWNEIFGYDNNQTLQQALNGIQSQISGLQSQINSLSARVTALGG